METTLIFLVSGSFWTLRGEGEENQRGECEIMTKPDLKSQIFAQQVESHQPDQVFVDLPGGADVRLHRVLVLTELSSQTQVLEDAKQKLLPLLLADRVIMLRVLLLQHLEQRDSEFHIFKRLTNGCWETLTCLSSS